MLRFSALLCVFCSTLLFAAEPLQPLGPTKPLVVLGTTDYRCGHDHGIALDAHNKVAAIIYYGTVRFMDLSNGQVTRTFRIFANDGDGALHMAKSGKELLRVGSNSIRAYDAASGKELRSWIQSSHGIATWGVGFSEDGERAAIFLRDPICKVILADLENNRELARVTPDSAGSSHTSISRNGELFATWGALTPLLDQGGRYTHRSIAEIWNVRGERIFSHSGEPIGDVRISPTNRLVAIAFKKQIQVYDLKNQKKLRELDYDFPLDNESRRLFFSPDEKTLICGGKDSGNVITFSVESGHCLRKDQHGWHTLYHFAVDREGQILGIGRCGQIVVAANVTTGKPLTPTLGHSTAIEAIGFDPSSKTVFSASAATMYRWTLTDANPQPRLHASSWKDTKAFHLPSYGRGPFAADGRHFIGIDLEGRRIIETETGRRIELAGAKKDSQPSVLRFGSLPDQIEISGAPWEPKWVGIVSRTTGASMVQSLPEMPIREFAFSPDLQLLAFTTSPPRDRAGDNLLPRNGKSKFDDLKYELIVRPSAKESAVCFRMALEVDSEPYFHFLDNSTLLFGKSHREQLLLLNPRSGHLYGQLQLSEQGWSHLTLSADRRYSATVCNTGRIQVHELASGQCVGEIAIPSRRMTCMAFNLEGNLLGVGFEDTTVRIYDMRPTAGRSERPTAEELSAALKDLGNADAKKAQEVMDRLVLAPEFVVPTLAKTLKPTAKPNVAAEKIKAMILDLDASEYRKRQSAEDELIRLGPLVREPLEVALKEPKISSESHERIKRIQAAIEKWPRGTGDLALVRAIELLERIATPEAIRKIDELALGWESWPTHQAQMAQQRLKWRANLILK